MVPLWLFQLQIHKPSLLQKSRLQCLSSPRPGARQDVAALAAFLASFGGGAGLNCRERCGWVFGRISRLRGHFTDTPMYSMNIEYCFEKDYPPSLPKFQPKL